MLSFSQPLQNNTAEFYLGQGEPTSKSNKFNTMSVLRDWDLRKDNYKVDSLVFSCFENLKAGEHVKMSIGGVMKFGGQIYKPGSKGWGIYTYEALSYAQRLLTQVNLVFDKAVRASDVVKYVFTKKLVDTSILKPNIKNTKTKYQGLIFKKKTVLEVINQLIWLEWNKSKNIIDFNVDYDGVLTFKSQPATVKGVEISQAISTDFSMDYSDIATGYTLYDEKNKKLDSWKNSLASKIWGNIYIVDSLSKTDNLDPSGSVDSTQSEDVTAIMNKINLNLRHYKHCIKCSGCDCWCMSDKIFEQLKAHKITCKIVQYDSGYVNNHRTVRVKDPKKGWIDFDYTGMSNGYKTTARSKTSNNIIKQYP